MTAGYCIAVHNVKMPFVHSTLDAGAVGLQERPGRRSDRERQGRGVVGESALLMLLRVAEALATACWCMWTPNKSTSSLLIHSPRMHLPQGAGLGWASVAGGF